MTPAQIIEKFKDSLEKTRETGFVEKVAPPIVYVSGLPHARHWEIIFFESGCLGVVMSLTSDFAEIMVLSNESLPIGTQASRSGELFKISVGNGLMGHTLGPLGEPLYDNTRLLDVNELRDVDTVPLGIESREKVKDPLVTGVSVVDFLIPLGKGQRELIIGDRNIGKTTLVMQTMLSQARKGTICIYAGIGKRKDSVKIVEQFFERYGIQDDTIIVSSFASDPIGYIFLTPFTAMTIAEYFRDQGRDVLLVLDDLTLHAKYYRELSLLAKKFPGRDSYPGDIFYSHARLLERAGSFKLPSGKIGTITCLPICETIEGDMSGYIQTNLMSITDGHIFFDLELFKEGKRPAINYSLSVTRVGRQTQSSVRWGINRELSSFLILNSKTERFIHFGAEVNEGIKSTLEMGERINFFFDQSMEEILDINVQIVIFSLIWTGILKEESQGKIKYYMHQSQKLYETDSKFKDTVDKLIDSCESFNDLLGKISSKYKTLFDYIERSEDEKR